MVLLGVPRGAHLSEIRADCVNLSWFDRYCDWSIDPDRWFSPKRLPKAAVPGKTAFVFNCLMRNYWEGLEF
jgi:hypothetical protein